MWAGLWRAGGRAHYAKRLEGHISKEKKLGLKFLRGLHLNRKEDQKLYILKSLYTLFVHIEPQT